MLYKVGIHASRVDAQMRGDLVPQQPKTKRLTMLDETSVYWRIPDPDEDGVEWVELIDPQEGESDRDWVIAYRQYYGSWHVMWRKGYQTDRLIKRLPEEELRARLQTMYLLQRNETNRRG